MSEHCHGDCHDCALADARQPADAPRGWDLAWRTVVGFLLPLVLALLGAVLWRADAGAQFVGATGGLFLGLTVATLVSRLSRPGREARQ